MPHDAGRTSAPPGAPARAMPLPDPHRECAQRGIDRSRNPSPARGDRTAHVEVPVTPAWTCRLLPARHQTHRHPRYEVGRSSHHLPDPEHHAGPGGAPAAPPHHCHPAPRDHLCDPPAATGSRCAPPLHEWGLHHGTLRPALRPRRSSATPLGRRLVRPSPPCYVAHARPPRHPGSRPSRASAAPGSRLVRASAAPGCAHGRAQLHPQSVRRRRVLRRRPVGSATCHWQFGPRLPTPRRPPACPQTPGALGRKVGRPAPRCCPYFRHESHLSQCGR